MNCYNIELNMESEYLHCLCVIIAKFNSELSSESKKIIHITTNAAPIHFNALSSAFYGFVDFLCANDKRIESFSLKFSSVNFTTILIFGTLFTFFFCPFIYILQFDYFCSLFLSFLFLFHFTIFRLNIGG